LINSNHPISQAINLPLAIQANMAAGLSPQTGVTASAFNQANVAGTGAATAPVVTLPTAINTAPVGGWTSFNTPTGPGGLVTGITAGVSAGNTANPSSVAFSITTTGPTATFNNPFTRIEF